MADDCGSPYSCSAPNRPVKRQRSTMWGKNPLGIIVVKSGATPPHAKCNICSRTVIPGQRIIVDEQYGYPEMWWNHLECVDLSMFSQDDEDVCTYPSTSAVTKACAWCTKPLLAGVHQMQGHWMGWTHATCDVGKISDFVDVLRCLQKKYPVKQMPVFCHGWHTLDELKRWADMQSPAVLLPTSGACRFSDAQVKSDPDRASVISGVSSTSVVIKPDPDADATVKADPEAAIDSSSQKTQVYGSSAMQNTLGSTGQATQVYAMSPATPPQPVPASSAAGL